MVAAAGNDAIDTRFVSPAGYDQVITVGAISDFDGKAGAKAEATCGGTFLGSESDDRYARYSNRGGDVDILAPGTCVLSTYTSSGGDATQRLTGTSMATPHVTGAVARYLAGDPGTEPERMRRIVRSAGRLDWVLASDPGWDGPGDSAAPRRLLDVAALQGSPGLRVWLVPRAVITSDVTTSRRIRVDLQRLGGYDGDVALRLEDLPGAAGDATLEPGTLALGDLGARLTLAFDRDSEEGRHRPRVTATGGDIVRGRRFDLRLDRSGPRIGAMRVTFQGERATGGGKSSSVRVAWSLHDALGRVGRTVLQRRVGDGRWREVASGKGLRTATTSVRTGKRTSLRVISRDDLGNTSRSRVRTVQLSMRDSSSARWSTSSSGWETATSGGAIGGSLLTTRSSTSSLTTDIEGSAFAIVAPVGPRRGSLRLRVDSGPWRTIDLRAKKPHAQRIVHRSALGTGTHTLEVRVRSGEAAIDALLLIR
jgi:hypothetical protein